MFACEKQETYAPVKTFWALNSEVCTFLGWQQSWNIQKWFQIYRGANFNIFENRWPQGRWIEVGSTYWIVPHIEAPD